MLDALAPRVSMFRPEAFSRATRRLLALPVAAALLGLQVVPAVGEVAYFGSVNPNPPELGGTQSGTITVGDQDDSDSNLLYGYLEVNSGTGLGYDQMVIGDEDDTIGDVVVTGSGSTLTLDATSTTNPALIVGEDGTGFLEITDGALVDVSDSTTSSGSSGTATIGEQATGAGFVTVDGQLSRLYIGDNLIVGESGYGELTVTNGAFVFYTDPDDGTLVVGEFASGTGVVNIDGSDTFFQAPETVTIGTTGAGTLRVTGGATLDAANGFGGSFTVGGSGEVELGGGANLLTDSLTVTGRVEGDGLITGAVTNATGGEIGAGPGQTLRLTGAVSNEGGLVNVSGDEHSRAEIEFIGAVTNTDPGGGALTGRIAVADGVVRFNQALTNDGTLASTSGVTDFHGEITNGGAGLIAIGGGSNATFYDDVSVAAGTLNIAAGSTALFLGDISISAGVTAAITLDESALEDDAQAPIQVSGLLTLGESIALILDGFVPDEGDSFELIEAAGGLVVDTLSTNSFDTLPTGLMWDLVLTENGLSAVVIEDNPAVNGDYNGDGIVDLADYTVWRDLYGMTGEDLAADADGNNEVDINDYVIWQENFGLVTTPLIGGVAPEPAALGLLAVASSLLAVRRRR